MSGPAHFPMGSAAPHLHALAPPSAGHQAPHTSWRGSPRQPIAPSADLPRNVRPSEPFRNPSRDDHDDHDDHDKLSPGPCTDNKNSVTATVAIVVAVLVLCAALVFLLWPAKKGTSRANAVPTRPSPARASSAHTALPPRGGLVSTVVDAVNSAHSGGFAPPAAAPRYGAHIPYRTVTY